MLLNFSPDHLDRHPSVEAYGGGEGAHLREPARAATGPSSTPTIRSVLALARTRAREARVFLRAARRLRRATAVEGGWIVDRRGAGAERLVPLDAVHLLGPHLVDDVMAAATVGAIAGAAPAAITAAVESFEGLEHAMERVATIGGVRVRQRLEGDQRGSGAAVDRELRRRVVPIIGGRFKGGDLRLLRAPLSSRAQAVVAIGEARPLVRDASAGAVEVDRGGVARGGRARRVRAGEAGRAWCCSRPRARASTCSVTTRSEDGDSRRRWAGSNRGPRREARGLSPKPWALV